MKWENVEKGWWLYRVKNSLIARAAVCRELVDGKLLWCVYVDSDMPPGGSQFRTLAEAKAAAEIAVGELCDAPIETYFSFKHGEKGCRYKEGGDWHSCRFLVFSWFGTRPECSLYRSLEGGNQELAEDGRVLRCKQCLGLDKEEL